MFRIISIALSFVLTVIGLFFAYHGEIDWATFAFVAATFNLVVLEKIDE